jgi:hypothetical protein
MWSILWGIVLQCTALCCTAVVLHCICAAMHLCCTASVLPESPLPHSSTAVAPMHFKLLIH